MEWSIYFMEYKLYTPPYHPTSNGRIEWFHAFLKGCIAKLVAPQLEWDVLVPLACAAYNFIPNEHSKESPSFLKFERGSVLPLNTLLSPKMRYLGNDINVLSLKAMKNMFEIVATNLKMAQERGDPKDNPLLSKLQPGETILVQNHTRGLYVHAQYELEETNLATMMEGMFISISTALDIKLCLITNGHLCMFDQALYLVEHTNWCIYALFINDKNQIKRNCLLKTLNQTTNLAYSLDGYLWAISALAAEKLQVRCVMGTHVITIKPPLQIMDIGNGC